MLSFSCESTCDQWDVHSLVSVSYCVCELWLLVFCLWVLSCVGVVFHSSRFTRARWLSTWRVFQPCWRRSSSSCCACWSSTRPESPGRNTAAWCRPSRQPRWTSRRCVVTSWRREQLQLPSLSDRRAHNRECSMVNIELMLRVFFFFHKRQSVKCVSFWRAFSMYVVDGHITLI